MVGPVPCPIGRPWASPSTPSSSAVGSCSMTTWASSTHPGRSGDARDAPGAPDPCRVRSTRTTTRYLRPPLHNPGKRTRRRPEPSDRTGRRDGISLNASSHTTTRRACIRHRDTCPHLMSSDQRRQANRPIHIHHSTNPLIQSPKTTATPYRNLSPE